MGNQHSEGETIHRVRYRTIESRSRRPSQYHNLSINERESRVDSSFQRRQAKNNKSFEVKEVFQQDQPQENSVHLQPIRKKSNRYQSLDFDDIDSRRATPYKANNDKVLDNLSKKNQQLRLQLKKINDELTEQLKKKKFVPKKQKKQHDDDYEDTTAIQKQNMGLKRQLENGYKQIEMYKRTIENLKGKEENDTSEYRLQMLEGNVKDIDKEVERYMKRIQGIRKIKQKQDTQIDKDINDDLRDGVAKYKKQAQFLKKKLQELANRDRQRQANYKKQQAYLCDLQRKSRQVNGQFFPQLKSGTTNIRKDYQKTAASDKDRVDPKQFRLVEEQAKALRAKHQQYYRKIDIQIQNKNRSSEDKNWMAEQIAYKQRIIQALKIKIDAFRNFTKPRKNGLFGYENSEYQSDYNETPSEIENQLMEELNQDQFDIKHLIANIPKPIRKRPQQMSNGYSSQGSGSGKSPKRTGIMVTNEKASPKKWGKVSSRVEEKGRHFHGELSFEDRAHFDGDVQPLIVGLNIWVDKNNVILGIQAIYLNKGEIRYGVKSSDIVDGLVRRFDLKNPDYLKNLSFTVSQDGFIESLTLNSKMGVVGKFGNKRASDQNINFGLSSNQRPYFFLGASTLFQAQPRINILGVQICQQ